MKIQKINNLNTFKEFIKFIKQNDKKLNSYKIDLEISNERNIKEKLEEIKTISGNLKIENQIQNLTFINCYNIPIIEIKNLINSSTNNLKKIKFDQCNLKNEDLPWLINALQIRSDKFHCSITNNQPALDEIDLSRLVITNKTPSLIIDLIKYLKSIKRILITPSQEMNIIAQNIQDQTRVEIMKKTQIEQFITNPNAYENFIATPTEVHGKDISYAFLKAVNTCKNLKTITLYEANIRDAFLENLKLICSEKNIALTVQVNPYLYKGDTSGQGFEIKYIEEKNNKILAQTKL